MEALDLGRCDLGEDGTPQRLRDPAQQLPVSLPGERLHGWPYAGEPVGEIGRERLAFIAPHRHADVERTPDRGEFSVYLNPCLRIERLAGAVRQCDLCCPSAIGPLVDRAFSIAAPFA